MMPEQLRRDVGALTGWTRHVGIALIAITGLLVLVTFGVVVALIGVRTALDNQQTTIDNQDTARDRDRCTIELIAGANADLFDALVELDRDGNISDQSSQALAEQAETLDNINEHCAP